MAAPFEIEDIHVLNDRRELLISWKDGHRSLFQSQYLRSRCPCAYCVDEWTGVRKVNETQISSTIELVRFAPVGRYGLRLDWSDNHNTGIYSLEYLRGICSCSLCVKEPS
jgi:DUF971 family protein